MKILYKTVINLSFIFTFLPSVVEAQTSTERPPNYDKGHTEMMDIAVCEAVLRGSLKSEMPSDTREVLRAAHDKFQRMGSFGIERGYSTARESVQKGQELEILWPSMSIADRATMLENCRKKASHLRN